MTYTPNTPQATQRIADTQPLIQSNFTYIEDAIERDHAWQGNIIGTEDPGRHQTVSMPNQGTDIVALPTGCDTVEYCIGGNKYMWNGAKRPISGITVTGSNTFNTSPVSIATLPNDCIGYVMFVESNIIGQLVGPSFSFMTNAGVGTVTNRPPTSTFSIQCTTTSLTATHDTSLNTSYKIIYWPI